MQDANQAPPPLPPAETAQKKQFPCKQCGAEVEFQPGTTSLICPYCDHANPIPQSEDDIVEIDFHTKLAELRAAEPVEEHTTVDCDSCGATIDKPAKVDSLTCPFCDSNIVTTAQSRRLIKPKSLLPFAITREQAHKQFAKWVNSLWFAPNELKKYTKGQYKLNGMYIPYWTFDSNTTSFYRGKRGDHYYDTETYTTTENGKTVTKTRRVRKTRWRSASGTVWCNFNDILTPASNSLPRKYVEALEPWDLTNLVPYQDDYLSGFTAQSYSIELDRGFEDAREEMDSAIRREVKRDIGGDVQRIYRVDTQYDDLTFKHILLPMWISAYRYKTQTYRFLINARTGEVKGERPWSLAKILTAVLIFLAALAMFVLSQAALQ